MHCAARGSGGPKTLFTRFVFAGPGDRATLQAMLLAKRARDTENCQVVRFADTMTYRVIVRMQFRAELETLREAIA